MLFSAKLFLLELKRMFKLMPKLFLGALALCGVLSGLAYGSQSLLYSTKPQEKLNILIYVPENDRYINMMMGIVENIKSVESLCSFNNVGNTEDIYTAVENGTAYAGIIFPKNFVQSIVRGQNYSATLIIPEGTDTSSALFTELAEGGSGMLSAVQAGIYAFIDEYELSEGKHPSDKIIDKLNIEYVSFVLPRENYFTHTQWSATNTLTPTEYYIIMAITIFLLFFGMSCVKIVHTDYNQTYRLGVPYGFNLVTGFFIKHILIFILFSILSVIIFISLKIMEMDICLSSGFFMGIWLTSAIITGIYTLIKSNISSSLVVFAYTILTGVLSGCFIPVSFLPQSLNGLYTFMPTYYITQCFNTIFYVNEINYGAYFICLVIIYGVSLLPNQVFNRGEIL